MVLVQRLNFAHGYSVLAAIFIILAGFVPAGQHDSSQVRSAWEVANVRLHRETGKRPCDAFKDQKLTVQPWPLAGYDSGFVAFMTNRFASQS